MNNSKLTSESLEQKINNISERFNNINSIIKEKSAEMDNIRKEIVALQDEQKRLQGEYRFIINLGKEYGLIEEENEEDTKYNEKPKREITKNKKEEVEEE